MKKMFVLVAMLALSGVAFADGGGEGNNTGCNGVGNPNSPCDTSGSGGGGTVDPHDGGNGNSVWQGQAQGQFQFQGQAQGQSQVANATAVAGAVATGGSATIAEGAVTNNNTATGGEGGSATATATIAEGAVVIERGAFEAPAYSSSYSYTEQRQAPAVGQGSFAISGCSVGGNAGGSNIHGSAFLGFGWTPQECYKFMLAQAYQSIGEKKAVCDILRNTKVGRRLEKDGVVLPECVEQVVIVATPVAPQVDLTPYATKEEVNEKVDRAFRASQEK